jgi:hypothetical protein
MARESDFLSRKEASAYLAKIGCPLSVQTLANLAANQNAGNGPPFLRIRKKIVRYQKSLLDEWAYKHTTRVG